MATVVQDLVTKFSFTGSTAPLTNYNETLGSSIKLLGGMLLGLEAAAGAFAFWSDGVLTGVDALDQLSRATNVSVANIQELNFIAGQTQSTSAAMESTIRSLGQTIGSAAQKGSEDFARLGISVRDANGQVKNADVILDEVRQRFQALGLSLQEQEHFASALGIDSSLIQLMGKTNSEMASMRDRARELGTLTAEQTEQANLYKKSLNAMWFSLNSVKQLVAVGVAPQMAGLADTFTQLLADNKDWIIGGIQFAVTWIGNLLAAFKRLLPVFVVIGAGFLTMKIAALGFGTTMGLIFSPVVLMAAGVAALLFVVDDLIVAFTGGKSVIADFFQDTFDIDIVESMTSAFQFLLINGINPIVDSFKFLWSLWQQINGAFASGASSLLQSIISIGSDSGNSNSTSNNTIVQDVTIAISTDDPEAAGRGVTDGLQRQLDNANTQLGTGGK